ncbi:cytochrome P450 [Penicillium malachiteum]|nr:cytochrome P450 [Penicillium malachiteum]
MTSSSLSQCYAICGRTPISSSNHLMLRHPKIFPDPDSFDPDRWIRAASKGERLEKYLVNFSKGSRSCLCRHLAIAEMFLTLASLIRRFDLEIHDTLQANIECGCDFGVPYGNLSVCTLITGLVQE